MSSKKKKDPSPEPGGPYYRINKLGIYEWELYCLENGSERLVDKNLPVVCLYKLRNAIQTQPTSRAPKVEAPVEVVLETKPEDDPSWALL